MSDAPMSYFTFHRYISNSRNQSDWIDNLYKCDITNKLSSAKGLFANTGLQSSIYNYIFKDYLDVLSTWVYDNNYGRENNTAIIYNHKEYNTVEEIYELLCKIFNKEIKVNSIFEISDNLYEKDEYILINGYKVMNLEKCLELLEFF